MQRKRRLVECMIVVLGMVWCGIASAQGTVADVITADEPSEPMTIVVEPIPSVTHGPITGELTATSAVLWARGNSAGTLVFEVAQDGTFDTLLRTVRVESLGAHDFAGKVLLDGLSPSQRYDFRVFLLTGETQSASVSGTFRTAPADTAVAPLSFSFGAGLGGQGYCRKPETGWTIFRAIQAEQPDFFLMLGDSVYVDSACPTPDNVFGSEGPYTDLEGFRQRYRYHLLDQHYAQFLAQTPVYATWDDHEIADNFSGTTLRKVNPQLWADGLQAYLEYWPIIGSDDEPQRIYRNFTYGALSEFFVLDTRSYRDPIVNWDTNPRTLTPKTMLGEAQFQWLQQALMASTATWKFIVSSVPLSYPTGWPQPEVDGRDGWANYTERSGYESELQSLLFFVEHHRIDNVIFLTGDTHWPFAISYDQDRDGHVNFYEFGSSPLSAIPLAPPKFLDPTLQPTVLYAEGEFRGTLFNFGHVAITENGVLTFRVLDGTGQQRYTLTVDPK